MSKKIYSHLESEVEDLVPYVHAAKERLHANLKGRDLQDGLKFLEEVQTFPFGRFFLAHRGLNGFWTHYAIVQENLDFSKMCETERFFLTRSVTGNASRERLRNMKTVLQKCVDQNQNCRMASVPCGVMAELLTLQFPSSSHPSLLGIDIDPESLKLAEDYAREKGLEPFTSFLNCDAWALPFKDEFDAISSTGLNIYVEDPEKVAELYRGLYQALKKGGTLVTAYIRPREDWDYTKIDAEDLRLSTILSKYLLNVTFMKTMTDDVMKSILAKIGYKNIQLIDDKGKIFPVVVARK